MRKVQNEMLLLPDVSFFPPVPSSGGGMARQQPGHPRLDLEITHFLIGFCREAVESISPQGGGGGGREGGEGKKAGGG